MNTQAMKTIFQGLGRNEFVQWNDRAIVPPIDAKLIISQNNAATWFGIRMNGHITSAIQGGAKNSTVLYGLLWLQSKREAVQ